MVNTCGNEYRNVKTTSQFYELISNTDLSELIKMKGQKPERIHSLVKFLKNEKVETEDDFYIWLVSSDNLLRLSNIKGIKCKTIDYLKILSGHKETVAIDIRLINFIKICCPELENVSYEFGHNLLMKTAIKLNVEPATLDFSIWSYMTNHKKIVQKKVVTENLLVDVMWNGLCPESLILGKRVRMKLNRNDFFESEKTGLQILVLSGVQAVILNFRGKGEFKVSPKYADEIENGEILSPQNSNKIPFNNPTEIFDEISHIVNYVAKIKANT